MKFSLLLFVLMRKLKQGIKKYPDLKEKVKMRDFTILIKTEDGKRGKFFTFSNGAMTSGPVKKAAAADVSMVWRDADIGFRVMVVQKDEAFMKAIGKGALKIQGDMNLLPVFMKIVKGAMQKKRK